MYDKVNQGETFIQNPQGKTFIKANQAGFVPSSGRLAPKLLPGILKFYRATRNEQEIERERGILKPQIEKRRLEQRQSIQQKRATESKRIMQEKQQRGKSPSAEKKRQLEQREQLRQNEQRSERHRFTEENKKQNHPQQRRREPE